MTCAHLQCDHLRAPRRPLCRWHWRRVMTGASIAHPIDAPGQHYTVRSYNAGCRCADCRAAMAEYTAERRKAAALRQPMPGSSVAATAAMRRLRALAVIGWSTTRLAAETGLTQRTLWAIRAGRQERILRATDIAIEAAYERRWDQTPDDAPGAITACRTHAVEQGWAPPLAWDDSTISDPHAAPAEWRRAGSRSRADEIRELLDLGETVDTIAQRYGVRRESIATMLRRAG